MKDIVHVVCDCQGLRLPHKTSDQLTEGIQQGHCGRKADEKRYMPEGSYLVRGREGIGYRVHDQLHEVECQERQRTLYKNKGQTGNGPAWPCLEYKAHCSIKTQRVPYLLAYGTICFHLHNPIFTQNRFDLKWVKRLRKTQIATGTI
jgi:hypothetical protein